MNAFPAVDFIFFDRSPIDFPFPRNSHQMSRTLARQFRILYVEPPSVSVISALRHPRLLAELLPALARFGRAEPWRPNMWRLRPFNFYPDYRDLKRFARLNAWLVRRQLRRAMKTLQIARPVLWFYHVPSSAHIEHVPHRAVVCSLTDDIASFPSDYPQRQAQLIELERALMERADVVFCTAPTLKEQKSRHNSRTIYLPNALDADLFSKTDGAEPGDLQKIPHPRIGVVACVNWRMNLPLLASIARARPQWSIVVVGDIEYSDTLRPEDLPQAPNIHWLGARGYTEMPAYQRAMDVLLMPSLENSNTTGSFPIRFFEHLASGRPVISVPMPALAEFSAYFHTARTAEEFIERIESALAIDPESQRQERQRLALKQSWTARVEIALEQLAGVLK